MQTLILTSFTQREREVEAASDYYDYLILVIIYIHCYYYYYYFKNYLTEVIRSKIMHKSEEILQN